MIYDNTINLSLEEESIIDKLECIEDLNTEKAITFCKQVFESDVSDNFLIACAKNRLSFLFEYLPKERFDEEDLAKKIANASFHNIRFFSEKWTKNESFLLSYINKYGEAFNYASSTMSEDLDFALEALKVNKDIINLPKFRNVLTSFESMKRLIQTDMRAFDSTGKMVRDEWWPELIDLYIEKGGENFLRLNLSFASEKSLLHILNKSFLNFEYLSKEQSQNINVLALAMGHEHLHNYGFEFLLEDKLKLALKNGVFTAKEFISLVSVPTFVNEEIHCVLMNDLDYKRMVETQKIDFSDLGEQTLATIKAMILRDTLEKDNENKKKAVFVKKKI